MNTLKKRRLVYVLLLCLCSFGAVFLVILALRSQVNLFFSPTQVFLGEAKMDSRIRIGGMVEKASIKRGQDLSVQFVVTDFKNHVTIEYKGILPDLFKEGQGVVAMGKLKNNTHFIADEILANTMKIIPS